MPDEAATWERLRKPDLEERIIDPRTTDEDRAACAAMLERVEKEAAKNADS